MTLSETALYAVIAIACAEGLIHEIRKETRVNAREAWETILLIAVATAITIGVVTIVKFAAYTIVFGGV